MKKLISLKNICRSYRNGDQELQVLKNINLEVNEGEFVAIMGPSGCGKSTLLNILGLLDNPTEGTYELNGTDVSKFTEAQRTNLRKGVIGFVFQSFNLIDELNVFENIAFGLRLKKTPENIIKEKVADALKMVQLSGYENREISQMSGGQQQRVAIARALVNEPEVLLLDEPLSALDLKLRTDMQYELRELQQRLGITFIFVTHDQEEALAMSDEIFVMSKGEIVQSGTPVDIYDEPINRFVADFIGESNIVDGVMKEDYLVEFVGKEFECADAGMRPNEKVEIVIRPEDLTLTSIENGKLTVEVDTQLFRGVHYEIICYDENGNEWMIHSTRKAEVGSKVGLYFEPHDIHVMRFGESEEDFDARLESYEDEVEEND